MAERMKVLVLGASGMLGHTVFRFIANNPVVDVVGSVRTEKARDLLPRKLHDHVHVGIDVDRPDTLEEAFSIIRPQILINCVGVVKQLSAAADPLVSIPINSLLPHRLARLCASHEARLLHVSTDCVFAGTRGLYRESDAPDANDLYGRSKLLGEVDYPNAVTLRTSIIGPELNSAQGLVGWFLSQRGSVRGFRRAIFSGLPTVELARVMLDLVIPRPALRGVYHVAADPINKFDLLTLVNRIYDNGTQIVPDDALVIDRSLDGSRFREATGYTAPPWPELVSRMREFG